MEARLIILFGGRPLTLKAAPDEYVKAGNCPHLLTIDHENGEHHVDLFLTDADLAMADAEFKARFVEPVINCLDGLAFPDRQKRLISAIKEQAREMLHA